jgi:hypothetical protein
MIQKLFIGYRTQLVADAHKLLSPRETPEGGDPVAVAKTVGLTLPYTATFAEIFVIDTRYRQRMHIVPANGKLLPSRVLRDYIVKHFVETYYGDGVRTNRLVFIGFGMELFTTLLGTECSMTPERYLPPRVWRNDNALNVDELVLPDKYRQHLDLRTVLLSRRPADAASAKVWDALLTDWTGPGQNIEKDAQLAFELCVQFGVPGDIF